MYNLEYVSHLRYLQGETEMHSDSCDLSYFKNIFWSNNVIRHLPMFLNTLYVN